MAEIRVEKKRTNMLPWIIGHGNRRPARRLKAKA